jgi:hypothetical protein
MPSDNPVVTWETTRCASCGSLTGEHCSIHLFPHCPGACPAGVMARGRHVAHLDVGGRLNGLLGHGQPAKVAVPPAGPTGQQRATQPRLVQVYWAGPDWSNRCRWRFRGDWWNSDLYAVDLSWGAEHADPVLSLTVTVRIPPVLRRIVLAITVRKPE